MTNFKKQLVSAAAAAALVFNIAMPAIADTEIVISGNGSDSVNWSNVTQTSTTSVDQTNKAEVKNYIDADADTGKNDANFNTGGNVTIDTGNAATDVNVSNDLNRNVADVDCCAPGDTNVTISGNGSNSTNGVDLDQITKTYVDQTNKAYVKNYVDADSDTGRNDANSNTGGDVTIDTGNADADVSVSTTANVNSATVGNGGGSNPSATFMITGNGAYSTNYIDAYLKNKTSVDQDNKAYVKNKVDADADTGKNDANFNTGGDVTIMTGNAEVDVDVDNTVNFNHADVDCGCVMDVLVKLAGNGADSYNLVDLTLKNKQYLDQFNKAKLKNKVDADADTGKNDANSNTADPDGDPTIDTGNAKTDVDVSNSGNVNVIGDLPSDWPDMPDLPQFEFTFSWAAILALFGLSL